MRSRYFLLFLVVSSLLIFAATTSAQTDESDTTFDNTSETVHAPILGWYLIPVLGAMRRRRHELNERDYSSVTDILN